MPALAITLNQLAAALLGAGAYIYHTSQRGQWKACAVVCGCLIQRSSPDPYAALGAVAQVLIDYEAQQAAQDLVLTPAARAAYRAAWAASEGQPVPARFAAAEAAATATEPAACFSCGGTGLDYAAADCCLSCGGSGIDDTATTDEGGHNWPSTIRTEQDNTSFMQRLGSITGRPSAAEAATVPMRDTGPDDPDGYDDGPYGLGHDDEDDDSGRDYEEELAGDYYSQAFD